MCIVCADCRRDFIGWRRAFASQDEAAVRLVDERFGLADQLEAMYRAAVERVEKLTPAVLV